MANITTRQLAVRIRKNILGAIYRSKASHVASALSICDILAVLYGEKLVNPQKHQFFLSKGHAGVAVYSTLFALGIISEEQFVSYYCNGSSLGGHVSHKNVPGISLSTGSLGGGIAVANGVVTANIVDNTDEKVFVIVGDGECNEGSIWESVLYAGAKNLKNLIVIVDRNNLQGCGDTESIIPTKDLAAKFESFDWHTVVVDGHDHEQLLQAFLMDNDGPLCIVANTIKGKGVSFMENVNLWHYRNVDDITYAEAINEQDSEL
jgi:transketolase